MSGVALCFGPDFANSNRPAKGKSLVDLPDRYTVIDIETTGLDSHFDEIIEVAAIRCEGDAEVEEFQSLIKPNQRICDFITDLTGITNDMVETAPPLSDVLPRLRSFIGSDLLLGHNINFDINFLYDFSRLLELPPLQNDFVDTLRISRRTIPLGRHRLSDLVEFFKTEPAGHRAMSDCRATHACYLALKKYIKENDIPILTSWELHIPLSKQVKATTAEFNEDSPLFAASFAFTGRLERMTRRDAMQIVLDHGGSCTDNVVKETNYLVLGNNDYCKAITDGKSNKQKKAEKMQLEGHDIKVISENVFYDMIEQ